MYLNSHQADLDSVTNHMEKNTLFQLAVSKCDIQLLDLVLSYKHNINYKDKANRNCLFYAINREKGDNPDVVARLIEAGADLISIDNVGHSILTFSAEKNMTHSVEVLLNNKVNVNHKVEKDGNIALHYAVINQNALMVELLLAHNSDVDAINKEKKDSITIAKEMNEKNIHEMLVSESENKTFSLKHKLDTLTDVPKEVNISEAVAKKRFKFTNLKPIKKENLFVPGEKQWARYILPGKEKKLLVDLTNERQVNFIINDRKYDELLKKHELIFKKITHESSLVKKENEALKKENEALERELQKLRANSEKLGSYEPKTDAQLLEKKFHFNSMIKDNVKQILTRDILEFQTFVDNRMNQIKPILEKLIARIQKCLNMVSKDFTVETYGSNASELSLPWSDLDLVILPPKNSNADPLALLTDLHKALSVNI